MHITYWYYSVSLAELKFCTVSLVVEYCFQTYLGIDANFVLLAIQFFSTKPLPCDPSSLPKYPPSKEFDAKVRDEEARRYVLKFGEEL